MSSLWDTYNAKDSPFPIVVPLTFWVSSWVYCRHRWGKYGFAKCNAIHDFHSIGFVLLASVSLYFSDDTIFRERIMILFTGTYFLVDLVDCVSRQKHIYTAHAVLSLCLCVGSTVYPVHKQYRMLSQGAMTEISTPQLHRWQRTKSKADFNAFFALFTIFRILWVPFVLGRLYRKVGSMPGSWILVLYYLLQLVWWGKAITILLDYKEKNTLSHHRLPTTHARA